MQTITIGLDTAKTVFHFCLEDASGKLHYGKLHRDQVLAYFAQLPPALVVLEACGGAHYWARELSALGHEVRQLPAQEVAKYRRGPHKTDYRDAHAAVRASKDEAIIAVPTKSPEQQKMQALHRVREQTKKARHQTLMQIRGFVAEMGVTLPASVAGLRKRLPYALEDERVLPLRELIEGLYQEFLHQDERLRRQTAELERLAKHDATCRQLMRRRGIGPITATYVVACVTMSSFRRARSFAAWVGLVPWQYGTGGKVRLGHITKSGNRYLRTLFVHGARALLRALRPSHDDKFSVWARALVARRGFNVAVVAVANKLARQTWAELRAA